MPEIDLEVPVLIVGAGPAGLASSLTLGTFGVPHLLVEKHAGTAHTPRAHIVNQRTVEILRYLGIEEDFRAVATPPELMRDNLWVTSLAGREIARSEAWGTGPRHAGQYAAASPVAMANCPQTVFEPLLLDAARKAGSDIRFQHEFRSATEDADGVTSLILDRATGRQLTVRSRYLLGADGARSRVVRHAGLELEGTAGLWHAVNIWFRADLSRYLAHRPGVLVWNVMPGPLPALRLGGLICHKPFEEFVLGFVYDPEAEDPASFTHDDLVRRVHAVIGDDSVEVEIKGVATWEVNALVASRYARGRTFCMGDAVHRHPPTNGLGLNMSVQDAFNLAWKLALVLDGRGHPALLDSYTQERQPVGAQGVHRAITGFGEKADVEQALGFVPGQSEEEGWALLDRLTAAGPRGDEARAALREAVSAADTTFNAHGIELGYRYESDAVAPEKPTAGVPSTLDPLIRYVPTTLPGARLPHARIERGAEALSTLDLVDGLTFVLLTGCGGEGWAEAARRCSERFGVPVRVYGVGVAEDGPLTAVLDPYGEWENLREVGSTGCVLIRPDQHVAWREREFAAGSPERLESAMSRSLGYAA